MKPYMIPLSTAIWGPMWFKQGHPWKDKNGVWNGLAAEPFAPRPLGLCFGPETCKTHSPQTCQFLRTYRNQLDLLDYDNIIQRCERIGNQIKLLEGFSEEPIIILLVHETPQNPCSERRVIQEWFAAHGKEVTEWK